ncbi:MAG: hypothetical protein JRJ73_08295 [Deltaproteobacteria bacterium]|nr:hypothetical protein [Deltaproteobacteria bacterium]
MLNAIRNVNQLIIREKELPRLLQGICDNLIANRGYHTAWVAVFDESERLTDSAEAGLGQDFLPIAERLKSGDLLHCQRETSSGRRCLNQALWYLETRYSPAPIARWLKNTATE